MGVEILSEIWPDWQIVEQIGEGAFGKVYKAMRNDNVLTSYAAIKVITVPKNESEIESLQADGMSLVGAKSYLQGIVSDFINEIRLMESVKATSNIVSIEDYKVVERKEGIGWDIFIRMELLTPLVKSLISTGFSERDVIKLGIDICSALELCSLKNIVHRDIKPENIFVSPSGDYKIGDFGIARQLEKTSTALSSKGTFNYIAPEVAKGYKYDASVDIYSLGIVLYKLLNNNRLPFIDPHAENLSYADKKLAIDRRFSGEPLPPPVNASPRLASVVLMACSYNPNERFASPTAMKTALMRLLNQPNYVSAPVITYTPVNNGTPTDGRSGDRYVSSSVHGQRVQPPANNLHDSSVSGDRRTSQTANFSNVNNTGGNGSFNPIVNGNSRKNKEESSGKGITIAIILVAVVAIAVIIVACTALAGGDSEAKKDNADTTASVSVNESGYKITEPDFFYESPMYRYVDVDDQYDGDPLRMRTGPGKDGTEKIAEIPDGNYLYVYGGSNSTDEWVYVRFDGKYGWVLSKYLHEV